MPTLNKNARGAAVTADGFVRSVDNAAMTRSRPALQLGRSARRAIGFGFAAALLVAAAWLADAPRGPVVAMAGMALGWLIANLAPRTGLLQVTAEPLAAEIIPPAAPAAPPETDAISALRHDLRGILSPAMLIADRLQMHQDPAVQRAGEVVTRTVERAASRLAETRNKPASPPGGAAG